MSTDRRIGLRSACRKGAEWDAARAATPSRRDADEADSQAARAFEGRGRRVPGRGADVGGC